MVTRSLLQDIENDCQKKDLEIRDLLKEIRNNHRGKESEIRDLKEQVSKLSSLVRQLDLHKEPRNKVQVLLPASAQISLPFGRVISR